MSVRFGPAQQAVFNLLRFESVAMITPQRTIVFCVAEVRSMIAALLRASLAFLGCHFYFMSSINSDPSCRLIVRLWMLCEGILACGAVATKDRENAIAMFRQSFISASPDLLFVNMWLVSHGQRGKHFLLPKSNSSRGICCGPLACLFFSVIDSLETARTVLHCETARHVYRESNCNLHQPKSPQVDFLTRRWIINHCP